MEEERRRQLAWQSKSPSQDTPKRAHSRCTQNEVKTMRQRLYRSIVDHTLQRNQSTARCLFQPAGSPVTQCNKKRQATSTRYHPP